MHVCLCVLVCVYCRASLYARNNEAQVKKLRHIVQLEVRTAAGNIFLGSLEGCRAGGQQLLCNCQQMPALTGS